MLKRAAAVLAFLAVSALAARAPAKVYYVNRGVKYHIGNGHFGQSVDAQFLDAYPVVGPRWVQAFTVDRDDTVHVRIDHIWGVDDCAYCKDMIYIDNHPMARLFEDNNHADFETPAPLSMRVHPGHVYLLRIVSQGSPGPVDDFAIEGVAVASDAVVKMLAPGPVVLQPGQPLPLFKAPPPVVPPCEGTRETGDWLPVVDRVRGMLGWTCVGDPVQRLLGAPLDAGTFARIYLKVDQAGDGGPVDQFFSVLLGDPGTGWVLDFAPGQSTPFMGNVKLAGRYQSGHFQIPGWRAGAWNELQVARCPDGTARLWINGTDVGRTLSVGADSTAFRLRSGGLNAEVAEKPY